MVGSAAVALIGRSGFMVIASRLGRVRLGLVWVAGLRLNCLRDNFSGRLLDACIAEIVFADGFPVGLAGVFFLGVAFVSLRFAVVGVMGEEGIRERISLRRAARELGGCAGKRFLRQLLFHQILFNEVIGDQAALVRRQVGGLHHVAGGFGCFLDLIGVREYAVGLAMDFARWFSLLRVGGPVAMAREGLAGKQAAAVPCEWRTDYCGWF